MIRINLLPEEFAEKKTVLSLPLKEISVILLALMVPVWLYVTYHGRVIRRELDGVTAELSGLSPELVKADQLLKEMNQRFLPRKAFFDKLSNLELEWDRVMDSISSALPPGVWLTALTFSESPELDVRLEGLARPYNTRSSASLIGDFVTLIKKSLEAYVGSGNPAQAGSVFRSETFTQQRDTESQQLTEFIVEFRKKS